MDASFWFGIALGGALSLLASIIANLYSELIKQWLEQRRSVRILKRLDKERRIFEMISQLRRDQRRLGVYFSLQLARLIGNALVLLLYTQLVIIGNNYPVPRISAMLEIIGERSYAFMEGVLVAVVLAAIAFFSMLFVKQFSDLVTFAWVYYTCLTQPLGWGRVAPT